MGTRIWAATEPAPTISPTATSTPMSGAAAETSRPEAVTTSTGRDQPTTGQQIAQRHQQGQPDGVPDLGEGDHQAGRARTGPERPGDVVEHGLGVVEIGHPHPVGRRSAYKRTRAGLPRSVCAGRRGVDGGQIGHRALHIK